MLEPEGEAQATSLATGEALKSSVEIAEHPVAGEPGPSDGEACLRLGPLRRRADADTIELWLTGAGLSSWRVEQVFEKRKLLWVYLEPTSSESEARERLARREAQGLKDYMLINRGGLKNSISLGLFSSQESVNRRLAELADKGYQPVVVPRYQDHRNIWFDVLETAWNTSAVSLAQAPAQTRAQPVLCGQIAGALTSQ